MAIECSLYENDRSPLDVTASLARDRFKYLVTEILRKQKFDVFFDTIVFLY